MVAHSMALFAYPNHNHFAKHNNCFVKVKWVTCMKDSLGLRLVGR